LTGPIDADSVRPGAASLNSFRRYDRHPGPVRTRGACLSSRPSPAVLLGLAACLCLFLTAGCSKKTATFEDVKPADELYLEGLEILEGRRILWLFTMINYDAAIERFQAIIDNYPYSEYAVQAELAIADAYFADARYEEALSYYQDFPELHPNHERVPYTLLQAANSHYERVRAANRDQRPTREALKYLDKLMSVYPYTPEAEAAEEIWRELRAQLGRSVLMVAEFYMDREEYQSAADRFRDVLNEFPGLGLDAEALYKLGVCYSKMRLNDEAERIFQVILENYEGTEVADAAADLIPAAQ
jgi:outer membrane protein assembly factor BamD